MKQGNIISYCTVLSIGFASALHAGTATVELQSKSLVVLPTENNAGIIRFTSSDGQPTVPQHFIREDGRLGVSWELKPLNNVTNYETDIFVISPAAMPGAITLDDVIGFGRIVFSFPDSDVNENGVLDVLEVNMDADGWFYGQTTIDQMIGPNYFNPSFAGFFTKSRTYFGHLHVDMVDVPGDSGDDMETLGTIELLRATGVATYDRSAKKPELRFGLDQISFLGNFSYTGAAPFQVRSPDEIHLPAFHLQRSDGARLSSAAATLRRTGNRYTGDIKFNDGHPGTPWDDYVNWTLRIEDLNDANGDGVPDLSDVPPPRIRKEPKDKTVKAGKLAVLRVVAGAKGRKTFQWYFNGTPIEGATKPVLRLRKVQPESAGIYTVHVTGRDGGTAISRDATLTVLVPEP